MAHYQGPEADVLQDVEFPVQASEWEATVAAYADSLGVPPECAHQPTCKGDSTAIFRLPAYVLTLVKVLDAHLSSGHGKPSDLALYTGVSRAEQVATVYDLLLTTPNLHISAKHLPRTALLYLGKDVKTGEPRTAEITFASIVVKFKTYSLLNRAEVEMGVISHNPNYPGVSQEAEEKGAATAPQPVPTPAPVESPQPVEQE